MLIFRFLLLFQFAPVQAEEKVVPLHVEKWIPLAYSNIPQNKLFSGGRDGASVSSSEASIRVDVDRSAGPLIYPLGKALPILSFQVRGEWEGEKREENGPFDEDSVLRVGLVEQGTETLTGARKWFAADWVKKLFSLAPKGVGIKRISFFNITNRENQIGKARVHPKSKLIHESVRFLSAQPGAFEFTVSLEDPMNTLALWLSSDGDQTQSKFSIKLKEIRLQLKSETRAGASPKGDRSL